MNIINDMLVDKCFLDNANARAVVPAYKEKTDSGNPITLTDSVENKSLGIRLYGWSKQVVTTGKNLVNADDYYSAYKQSDGTYKSKTVTLNSIRISLSEFVGKEITISVELTVGVNTTGVYLMYVSSEQNHINGSVIRTGLTGKSLLTVTPASNTDYFVISYGDGNGDVTFSELQLELSSVATSYEPYTGGKPSPSPEYPQDIQSAGYVLSTGKNLINADEYYSQFKQSDGTYKGENTVINKIAIPLAHFVGKRIVISANIDFPSTIDTMQIRAAIGENNYYGDIVYPNTNKRSVLTVTVQTQNDNFWFTYGSGSGQVIISDIQVELSTTATSYEPYTGGVPTLYQKDIEVRVTGKNILNFEDFLKTRDAIYTKESESYQITNIGKTYSNPYKFSDEDIDVAISCIVDNITAKGGRIDALDSSKKFVASTYYKDFAKCKASYIRLNYTENGIFNIQKVQIERGVTATSYEPYHEPQSLSISTPTGLPAIPVDTDGNYTDVNGQQWIADYIDLKRGKYVQRVWQKTFDGSESWDLYGDTGFFLYNILPEKMSNREMLCNQFRRRGGGTNSNIMIVGAFSTNSSIYIENCTLVDNTLVDDMLSKWKMHLAKHPLVVTTYLNEQIERDLTPEEVETYKNLVTYAGTTIVENDGDCWMDVTYKAGTSGKSKNEALRWYFKNVMPLVE